MRTSPTKWQARQCAGCAAPFACWAGKWRSPLPSNDSETRSNFQSLGSAAEACGSQWHRRARVAMPRHHPPSHSPTLPLTADACCFGAVATYHVKNLKPRARLSFYGGYFTTIYTTMMIVLPCALQIPGGQAGRAIKVCVARGDQIRCAPAQDVWPHLKKSQASDSDLRDLAQQGGRNDNEIFGQKFAHTSCLKPQPWNMDRLHEGTLFGDAGLKRL